FSHPRRYPSSVCLAVVTQGDPNMAMQTVTGTEGPKTDQIMVIRSARPGQYVAYWACGLVTRPRGGLRGEPAARNLGRSEPQQASRCILRTRQRFRRNDVHRAGQQPAR